MGNSAAWVSACIAFIMLIVAVVSCVVAYRKGRESSTSSREKKIEREAEERTEVKTNMQHFTEKLDNMDRGLNKSLGEIKQQYSSIESKLQDHDRRIFALEIEKKLRED